MDEILCDVEKAVHYEEARIQVVHGEKYNSMHEAYGVLKEELFEAAIELEHMSATEDGLLRAMHRNDMSTYELSMNRIANYAVRAACELIQVAAVCRKALGGVEVQDK